MSPSSNESPTRSAGSPSPGRLSLRIGGAPLEALELVALGLQLLNLDPEHLALNLKTHTLHPGHEHPTLDLHHDHKH